MQRVHSKTSRQSGPKRRGRRSSPVVLAFGAVAAGLLMFGSESASAQETTIVAETTLVATETTLVPGAEVLTAESTIVATADTAVDDSTPAGGLDTGFGGSASSDSGGSGLIPVAAGFTLLSALAVRKIVKRSSAGVNRQPTE